MTPPAALSAASSTCSRFSSPRPANRNETITTSAIRHSRRITHWRRSGAVFFSDARNSGTLPNGSITRMNVNAAEIITSMGLLR